MSSNAPKLCSDSECLTTTYICIVCRGLCCKHYCSNRDSKGIATCGSCILESRKANRTDDDFESTT